MFPQVARWIGTALLATPFLAVADDEFNVRGLVRKGIDDQGRVHGDLADATGLATATSLNYKVLLLNDDSTVTSVDASKTAFKFGQQFRIEIEADSDLYVYVFHEGPDAVRTVLMPDTVDKGRIPMVKKGQKKILPDDGTYFEFVPPAGVEKLLVYATAEKNDALTPKEAFESQGPNGGGKKQLELKNEQDKIISQSTQNQPSNALTTPDVKKVVEGGKVPSEFRLRGLRWRPEMTNPAEGQTVMVGSYDPAVRHPLYVEIALESQGQ